MALHGMVPLNVSKNGSRVNIQDLPSPRFDASDFLLPHTYPIMIMIAVLKLSSFYVLSMVTMLS
jgi:hypothetical protein